MSYETKIFDAVVNFSGGFDCTFVALDYMKNNPNKMLLLHHCIIKRKAQRNRWESELKAARNICRWFRRNGYNNFEFVITRWENEFIESTLLDQFFVNANLIALLMPQRKNYKAKFFSTNLLLSISATDRNYPTEGADKLSPMRELFLPHLQITKDPICNMTREQVILSLPEDLRKLPFFCQFFNRVPEMPVCRKCVSCRETLPILKRANEIIEGGEGEENEG